MAKTTYIATAPDGSEHIRKTDRTYTHAVLVEKEGPDGPAWSVAGFCGRPDLAEKKRADHPGSVVVECGVLGVAPADKPKVEAAETARSSGDEAKRDEQPEAAESDRATVGELVAELLTDPALGYREIVVAVKERFPEAQTSARSVASTACMLRRKGVAVPKRSGKGR